MWVICMAKLLPESLVVELPDRLHKWLNHVKDLGFDKKVIVMAGLDDLRALEEEELVSKLAKYHLKARKKGEVGR